MHLPEEIASASAFTQIAEERSRGAVAKTYVFGPQRVSMRDAGGVHYYGYDAHSGVRRIVDADGVVSDAYAFDAFGNVLERHGATSNEFTYRGEMTDTTSGLQYLRARWFDPVRSRLTVMDRFSNITGARYIYASQNPINATDPSGLFTIADPVRGPLVHDKVTEAFIKDGLKRYPSYIRDGNRWISSILKFFVDELTFGENQLRPDLFQIAPLDVVARRCLLWEVEPNNPWSIYRGDQQLARYQHDLEEASGTSWSLGSQWDFPAPSAVTVLGARVTFSYAGDGLIVYDFDNTHATAVGIALLVGTALFLPGAALVVGPALLVY